MAYAVGTEYFANQDVIIYSKSQGGWVPGRIESVNAHDAVTVRYETGHTKLVPLENQNDNLRPADTGCPPPEPTIANVISEGIFGPPACHDMPSLQPIGAPQAPSMPNYAGSPSAGQMAGQHQAASKYYVNQQVSVYSDSSRSWVLATVTFVAPNGCVTVKYGPNQGLQKTLEPARHHLLAPVTSGAGAAPQAPQAAPQTSRVYAQAAPQTSRVYAPQMAAPQPSQMYRPPPIEQQQNFDAFGPPPTEQVGTFKFDLSALCNDQAMAQPPPPINCNNQFNAAAFAR